MFCFFTDCKNIEQIFLSRFAWGFKADVKTIVYFLHSLIRRCYFLIKQTVYFQHWNSKAFDCFSLDDQIIMSISRTNLIFLKTSFLLLLTLLIRKVCSRANIFNPICEKLGQRKKLFKTLSCIYTFIA